MEIKLSSGSGCISGKCSEINCENYKFSVCWLLWLQIIWSSSGEISIYLLFPLSHSVTLSLSHSLALSLCFCGSKVKVEQCTDCSKCEFDDVEADWRLRTVDRDCTSSVFASIRYGRVRGSSEREREERRQKTVPKYLKCNSEAICFMATAPNCCTSQKNGWQKRVTPSSKWRTTNGKWKSRMERSAAFIHPFIHSTRLAIVSLAPAFSEISLYPFPVHGRVHPTKTAVRKT